MHLHFLHNLPVYIEFSYYTNCLHKVRYVCIYCTHIIQQSNTLMHTIKPSIFYFSRRHNQYYGSNKVFAYKFHAFILKTNYSFLFLLLTNCITWSTCTLAPVWQQLTVTRVHEKTWAECTRTRSGWCARIYTYELQEVG